MSYEDEFPELSFWNPEPKDIIRGTVTAVSQIPSEYHPGDPRPTVDILTDTGETVTVTGYRTVLCDELRRKNPQIGQQIKIGYTGLREPRKPGGKPYHHYDVHVIGGPATVNGDAGIAMTGALDDEEPF